VTRFWYLVSDGLNRAGFRRRAAMVKLIALKADTVAMGEGLRRSPQDAAVLQLRTRLSDETAWAYERIAYFNMVDLFERAAFLQLGVPDPPPDGQRNEYWTIGRFTRLPVLSDLGTATVRSAVRTEERERRDDLLAWAPVVTGLVTALAGLGGVIIGILAVRP